MNVKATLAAILAFSTIALIAEPIMAAKVRTVSIRGNNPDKVKGRCDGAYFPPTSKGVYGCLNKNGSGIACGGVGKHKKTCGIFREMPPQLPTREAIDQAADPDDIEVK